MHNLKSIRADIELQGEVVWDRFNRGKRDQHWYYSNMVKALSPRKKEFKLIGKLEKEVIAVFGSTKLISIKEISILFSCAYGIHDSMWKTLEDHGMTKRAREISKEAIEYTGMSTMLEVKLRIYLSEVLNLKIIGMDLSFLLDFVLHYKRIWIWTDGWVIPRF